MKKAKVIILAGQSNAVGVGFVKYLPCHFDKETVDEILAGYENIPIYYVSHDIKSNGFVKTGVNCTEASKDTLGPEVGIARVISKKYTDEKIYIIKCAFGATSLTYDWISPESGVPYLADIEANAPLAINDPRHRFEGWCYNSFVKALEGGFAALSDMGFEPEVKAFCWMQGEGDAEMGVPAEKYIDTYDKMLLDMKKRFAPYFEGCKYIEAGISELWQNFDALNQAKKEYADKNGHAYIDTIAAGLTTKNEPHEEPDTAHYDVDSAIKLGELFAENIIL